MPISVARPSCLSKVPLSSSCRVILFPELKQVRLPYSKNYCSFIFYLLRLTVECCLLFVNQGNTFFAETLIVSLLSVSKDYRTPVRVTKTAPSLFRSFLSSPGNLVGRKKKKRKKHIWETMGQITCHHTPSARYDHCTIFRQLLIEM